MIEDDIMREIREFREKFARDHNYDIGAMVETLRKATLAAGRTTVSFEPRRPTLMPVPPEVQPDPPAVEPAR